MEEVIILGSGPAGLTAALYAARAELSPLVLTGMQIGGQISITSTVENYPGFPQGLEGPELVQLMQEQAERFGARLEMESATAIDVSRHPFVVTGTEGQKYETRSLIVATGATPKKLEIPGEEVLTGRGVSYCATCDGYFFKGKDVVVVGGGDSALEEGAFLTRFADNVRIIHRRDHLRAGPILKRRAEENPKVQFVWNTVVTGIEGNGAVDSVNLQDTGTGQNWNLATDGVFIFIGHYPNTDIFRGQLEMNEGGYICGDGMGSTSVEGVFACGEVIDPIFRQIVTSAGSGCQAAMRVQRYLESLDDKDTV